MENTANKKVFDLEERTLNFATGVRNFVAKVRTNNKINAPYLSQILRSSSSIGANYIEAVESLGKKDYLMRLKICRKEAKETLYWFKLIVIPLSLQNEAKELAQEADEITKIFGSIVTKIEKQLAVKKQ